MSVPGLGLVILDGWGLAESGPGNAVSLAKTPVFDGLWARYPHTELTACGPAVGLPEGQMGNSEVGHLNLGAGAVVRQDLARIDAAIGDGDFFDNPVLRGACARARRGSGRLHLLGLVSDGGVHSGWEHIEACIELAAREGVPDLIVHALTDGRDTSPRGGTAYIAELERWLTRAGRVGTVGGRFFAMDRDRRWDRVERAWAAIAAAQGERAETASAAVVAAYRRGESDEFIAPTVIGDYGGIGRDDVVVCFNFRPDRMREIVAAIADPQFDEFSRPGRVGVELVTMTRYREGWAYPIAFAPRAPDTTLAEVLAAAGAAQLHVAETEKYAHVTYFFNGGREAEWAGEQRRLVASPRDVATYDQRPEMSAAAAADAFVEGWKSGEYRFGIINFANPDMVGHSGVIPAAVTAIEAVDSCLGRVCDAVLGGGGILIVTADHGNAEQMLEPDGSPNTAHSLNPVPLIVTEVGWSLRDGGILADVAPTILALLAIPQPEAMTGRSLLAPPA